MCDPLDFWFGNTEILESLSQYLRPWDLGKMSLVSRRWREALNVDHIWYRMCRRMDLGFIQLFGKFSLESKANNNNGLVALCDWRKHFSLCQGVRRRWRSGGQEVKKKEAGIGGQVTCYDCEEDMVSLGTSFGTILTWNIGKDLYQTCRTVLRKSPVDKIYTRHNMVIILQGGLIQVYQVLPVLQLLYCKSVEDPEQEDDHEDEFYISTDHLEQGYKPRRAIKYTDLDITISTQGQPLMLMSKNGNVKANVYNLTSGELEDKIETESGDTLLKIGLVPYEGFTNHTYMIVRDTEDKLVGTMYCLDRKVYLWRLYLGHVFSFEHSVYSVYTTRGMLMFGRHVSDSSYPYTWSWRGWRYEDGSEFFSTTFETEYPMCLADWRPDAVVTPRAMSYLYHGEDLLSFTQKTHRGVAIFTYSWGNLKLENNRKLWKSSCGTSVKGSANVPLCGSHVGGVIVTCHGQDDTCLTLTLRDMDTGAKIRDIQGEGKVEIMWSDDRKIVTISKEGDITVYKMC